MPRNSYYMIEHENHNEQITKQTMSPLMTAGLIWEADASKKVLAHNTTCLASQSKVNHLKTSIYIHGNFKHLVHIN